MKCAETLKSLQNEARLIELMVIQEEFETAPLGAIWNEYLKREGVDIDSITTVKEYEKEDKRFSVSFTSLTRWK